MRERERITKKELEKLRERECVYMSAFKEESIKPIKSLVKGPFLLYLGQL